MTNINALDLNLLKALDALIDTGSATRAADRLGLSQPAVSGMLTRLRDVFGDPLFVRAQRGLLPTARALELAEPLRRLLTEIEALVQPHRFDPASTQVTFRIAATDYAQTAMVLPLLKELREVAPGLRVAVRPVGANFSDELAAGNLDLALVTPAMTLKSLRARKLFDEDYVCILRAGHPDADHLDIETFCALDHAIMSHDGTQFFGATDRALEQLDRTRRVIATLPNFLVLVNFVRETNTIALVPRRLTHHAEGIIIREPPIQIEGFTKIAAWHERMQHDPAHSWLREKLVDVSSRASQIYGVN
ncbi:LysR family transcriptional regulator [Asticcacaulis sp. DW145]|uniref:Transcriptional regulator, LysR family n=1 Tax=Asticcacaulis excentricus (strain ATCC 15261 / DSM 4724 / KCTC 12464 / NCIMB 9791 / VKM B-1370 / CB 48) TaxID=573065 RepID=E8RUF6_ASTEC|nr:LysR family transcriptional regulator [Asticcacaulis excentricus]ADU14044.1 transcriptional regulator, LysR family [Asticcacaulis excentricus CB 48]BEV11868.1 LysR family transcriptional regulator [Asticcacaulis sp. DW145]